MSLLHVGLVYYNNQDSTNSYIVGNG